MLAIFSEEKKAFFLLRIAVEHIPDLLERIGFVFWFDMFVAIQDAKYLDI